MDVVASQMSPNVLQPHGFSTILFQHPNHNHTQPKSHFLFTQSNPCTVFFFFPPRSLDHPPVRLPPAEPPLPPSPGPPARRCARATTPPPPPIRSRAPNAIRLNIVFVIFFFRSQKGHFGTFIYCFPPKFTSEGILFLLAIFNCYQCTLHLKLQGCERRILDFFMLWPFAVGLRLELRCSYLLLPND